MKRRIIALLLLTVAVLTAFGWNAQCWAQAKIARIGFLTPARGGVWPDLREGLRELGYVEGRTIQFEARSAENNLDRLPDLAAELVRAKVDIIVAVSPPAIRAARQATSAIPIVMGFWGGEGLLESGTIASFARPGGNVTGVYMLAAELDAKRLELLLQAMPGAKRLAVLNPGPDWGKFAEVRKVAPAGRIQLYLTDVPESEGYEAVFETITNDRIDAVLVPSFPRFYLEHQQIIEAAAKRRVPAMYEWEKLRDTAG